MTKAGYTLIAIGLFLLALNYGWINFSILSKPLVMPFIFILAGLFSIINSVFKLGDFGEVLSTIFSLLLIATIIANIFNFPQINIYNPNTEAVVNLSVSGLTASFTDLNLSSSLGQVIVNYDSNDQILSQSSFYSANYSISNVFSKSYYDFSGIYGATLIFNNDFGESEIINLASFNLSKISNNFGQTTINTGKILGEKTVIVDNAFGNVEIYIDKDASYIIESNGNAFGTIENNVGLLSNDYSSAINKIKVIISNAFGTVEIYKQ